MRALGEAGQGWRNAANQISERANLPKGQNGAEEAAKVLRSERALCLMSDPAAPRRARDFIQAGLTRGGREQMLPASPPIHHPCADCAWRRD